MDGETETKKKKKKKRERVCVPKPLCRTVHNSDIYLGRALKVGNIVNSRDIYDDIRDTKSSKNRNNLPEK